MNNVPPCDLEHGELLPSAPSWSRSDDIWRLYESTSIRGGTSAALSLDVRFWHKADIPRLSSNVRFWG